MPRPLAPGRLVVASHNPAKVREIGALLAPFRVEAVSAAELGLAEPEETEASFAGNARLKALAAAHASRLPALADNSGLEVTSLGGAPGVFSARWAGPGRDFQAAMERVWSGIAEQADHGARFVCVLALAWPDDHVELFEGAAQGEIVWPPRGDKGFGYDPIFRPEGQPLTFAEMAAAAKEAVSHRAAAFRRFATACLGA